ncbi:MAG: glycosyltransferase, partial [Candidatus Woesearchaeota archaeon]
MFYVNINFKKGDKYSVEIISKNIFQITLPFINDTDIYQLKLEDNDLKILADCFEKLFSDFNIIEAVMFVEFPAWYPLVKLLKNKYNFPIIFDCLDEFAGFKNIKKDVVNYEDSLVKISDLCVATSLKLFQKHKELTKKIVLIKNGTDFKFFHDLPPNNLLSKLKKPIIGYYGAIAEWFDIESIEFVAKNRPDWNIVLIGRITNINLEQLKKYKNIYFIKEQPYSALPLYLYWFDVCLIPFKLNDLTLSTNPVKFYEYISSGKPVVTSNLPELRPYSDIAYISKNKEEFLANIECALNEKNNEIKEKRIKVGQTA